MQGCCQDFKLQDAFSRQRNEKLGVSLGSIFFFCPMKVARDQAESSQGKSQHLVFSDSPEVKGLMHDAFHMRIKRWSLKRDMDALNCMQKPMKYFPNKTG